MDYEQTAKIIQDALLFFFPDEVNFRHQCKRASILFDMVAKERQLRSKIVTGEIRWKGDFPDRERKHAWNVVIIDKEPFVVDLTLQQFEVYLKKEVPSFVFGRRKEIYQHYSYQEDGLGAYRYYHGDVRKEIIDYVFSQIR